MQVTNLLTAVIAISKAAGQAILTIYEDGAFDTTLKADNSPLTAADLAAHRVIVSSLRHLTPDIPVLSEESTAVAWEERQQWSRYWLIDPLDGTREFLKRNGEFTVNIALIEDGVPTLGVVYVPVFKCCYYGARGHGAWKEVAGKVTPITTLALEQGQGRLRVVESRTHRADALDAWLTRLQPRFPQLELVSMGSSLKICLVAEGMADLYPRLSPTSEWDTAAAQAILEAAGGKLVDQQGADYRYNRKADLLNPFFFAVGDATLLADIAL
jgi:3'(2'), 5'-bisphosphate nucleotidase